MDADFGLKTMYNIYLFNSDLGTLDMSKGDLFYSCSAVPPCTIFKKMYEENVMSDVVVKIRISKCVGKSLFAVYLQNTLFKDKFRHPFSELDLGTCIF